VKRKPFNFKNNRIGQKRDAFVAVGECVIFDESETVSGSEIRPIASRFVRQPIDRTRERRGKAPLIDRTDRTAELRDQLGVQE
jgi:hypothetical protein